MKKIILCLFVFILTIPISTSAKKYNQCEAQSILDTNQFEIVTRAYKLGKPYDYSYSLAAIVWQESSAGKMLINSGESSYGHFQINIKTAMSRVDKDGQWSKMRINVLATKLLDFEYAAPFAVKELQYWESVHGKDWNKIWASYNGGWSYDKEAPRKYSNDIGDKIQKLKGCF
jgi:hypothetical protein